MLEMSRVWPIVVQYGVGALLCLAGIWFGWKSGYLDMQHAGDRRLLWVFAAGFLGLLLLVCLFTFWLPFVPKEVTP